MRPPKGTKIILCAGLLIAVYSTFNTILGNGFISYDDGLYITENPHVLSGLNWDSVKWAFQTTQTGNWIPLTWLSHMLNVQLFGTNPGNHHLTDLVLHSFNTVLVFFILYKITGSTWASFLAALLFAVHPLRVESVAWVSERKDTLSTFLGLLSLSAYISYAKNKTLTAYCLSIVFLVLGLMAKAMLVTWPFVFLLLDYWPLKRFADNPDFIDTHRFSRKKIIPLAVEKIPFLFVVSVFSIIAYTAQKSQSAVAGFSHYALSYRVENLFISYADYLKQIFFPLSLGVFYPLEPQEITVVRSLICLVLIACLTLFFLCLRVRKPYLLVGWLWFLGTLLPVSGLVQIGSQSMADRYTYIPSIGISIAVAFLAADLARRGKIFKNVIISAAGLVVCTLIFLTWIQTAYWKNSLTLYAHTLKVSPNNYMIQMNYGLALAKNKNYDASMTHFQRASEILPNAAEPLEKMGRICLDTGHYEQAVEYLQKALTKKKQNLNYIFRNLGICYTSLNRIPAAIDAFNKALDDTPSDIQTMILLAGVYEKTGQYRKCLDWYKHALDVEPGSALAMNNLAMFYANKENPLYNLENALKYSQQACQVTDFKDKETLVILIRILGQNENLQNSLSQEFLNKLNRRIDELKGIHAQ